MSAPSSDNAAAEDEESSSSPSVSTPTNGLVSLPNDLRAALDEFRHNCQHDLQHSEPRQSEENKNLEDPEYAACNRYYVDSQQALAETLFQKAVQLEQQGKVYDALPFYRKAVQIVPDIEFKFYERNQLRTGSTVTNDADGALVKTQEQNNHTGRSSELEIVPNLYEKFQLDLANGYAGKLVLNNSNEAVISTMLHISDLPPEILFYILRWVVSSQLDMRSLEQCAAVCKGFFICARDEELWRLACFKVWGSNVGKIGSATPEISDMSTMSTQVNESSTTIGYSSWRQMFIERERVHFNGCYISKTTYLRMGENSFQDQYYRPVQLVEYFRYVRFLPDGTVLMMSNADEPVQGVNKLKQLQQLRQDVLRGQYRLSGNTVTMVLKKTKRQAQQYMSRQRRGSTALNEEISSSRTIYRIEFLIMKTRKRKFNHLVWQHYSIKHVRKNTEVSSEFDLTPSKYPPLWFSPVRSYHFIADAPLV